MADWRHAARCQDEDPERFFPIGTSGPALDQAEEAKAVCRRCPSIDACLRWALETGQDAGIWGGLTEEERRAVKRRGGLRIRLASVPAMRVCDACACTFEVAPANPAAEVCTRCVEKAAAEFGRKHKKQSAGAQ